MQLTCEDNVSIPGTDKPTDEVDALSSACCISFGGFVDRPHLFRPPAQSKIVLFVTIIFQGKIWRGSILATDVNLFELNKKKDRRLKIQIINTYAQKFVHERNEIHMHTR